MFSTSTQRKYWTFSGETEINRLRTESNQKFIDTHGADRGVDERRNFFLTTSEEKMLRRYYESAIREFCNRFQPPMPRYVIGTSLTYFKRFYVHQSVMDYHPKDIMLTCVYLACKVEEFNVSIGQFVANLKGDREKFADLILSHELLLMQHLHYHLTVHNPWRPLEGLFIDIKTNNPDIGDVEKIRPAAEEFLDRAANTDVCLVFAPSQVALAAILSSSSKQGMNLEHYVMNSLLGQGSKDQLAKAIEQIKRIRYMVKNIEPLNKELLRTIPKKLEACRNPENNPDSEVYKRKMEEYLEDEDDRRTAKRRKQAEEEKISQREVLGI